MIYLFQSSLALALLYTIYWLFLRRTSFHQLNRFVLLSIALATLLLPAAASLIPDFTTGGHIIANGHVTVTQPTPFFPIIAAAATNKFNLQTLIPIIYLLGCAFFLCRTAVPIYKLIQLIRRNKAHHYPDYTLIHLQQPSPPFSFFKYIFLCPGKYDESQHQNILLHEQVHIKQRHTADILFMELVTALFWFHPLAWRLNAATKLNLEYLADDQLLKTGVPQKEYQYHLLQLTLGDTTPRTANYFNQSHLKKRIAMMNTAATRRIALLKYAFFLPVLIALTPVFGTLQAQQSNAPDSDIYLVIKAEQSEASLQKIESYLAKDGINASFTDLSFTADHQLSGFRIIIRQGAHTLEDITIAPTGQPLSEPLVFYWFRSRQGQLGISRGYPTDLPEKDLHILQNLSGLLKRSPETKEFDLHGAARIDN